MFYWRGSSITVFIVFLWDLSSYERAHEVTITLLKKNVTPEMATTYAQIIPMSEVEFL